MSSKIFKIVESGDTHLINDSIEAQHWDELGLTVLTDEWEDGIRTATISISGEDATERMRRAHEYSTMYKGSDATYTEVIGE